jgi:UDP-glucose 4-epimerase
MLNQLRYGRGLDNRRLKANGFEYRYTSREAVVRFSEHLRLHPILRRAGEPYRYEEEVEEFLRWSPNVRDAGVRSDRRLAPRQLAQIQRAIGPPRGQATGPDADWGELASEEIVALLDSLEPGQLRLLRDHERATIGRPEVLSAIDAALERAAAAAR